MRSGWRARRRLNRMTDFGWSRPGPGSSGKNPAIPGLVQVGQVGQVGQALQPPQMKHTGRENAGGDAACVNGSLHGLHKHLDHLDHPDPASNGAVSPGPGIVSSLGPSGPALLREARTTGITLRLAGDTVKVGGALSPEFLARLRAHKLELAELLQGDRCRYCSGLLTWAAPNVLVFADRMSAHLVCYERAESCASPRPRHDAPVPPRRPPEHDAAHGGPRVPPDCSARPDGATALCNQRKT
jgi:hypothetical protein